MSTDATTGKAPAPRIVRIGRLAAPLLAAATTIAATLAGGPRVAWVPWGAAIAPEAWQQPLSGVSLAWLTLQVAIASMWRARDLVGGVLGITAVLGGLAAAALVVLLRRAGLRTTHASLLALVASAAPLAHWQASSPLGPLPLTLGSLALLAGATSSRAPWPAWSRRRGVLAIGLLGAGVVTALAGDGTSFLRLMRGEIGAIGLALLGGHLVARQRAPLLAPVAWGSVLVAVVGAWLPAPERLALLLPWLWWLVGAGLAAILGERPAHARRWAIVGLACWTAIHAAQIPWAARRQAAAAARTWADGVAILVDEARPLVGDDSARGRLAASLVAARHGHGVLTHDESLRLQVGAGRTPLVTDGVTRDRWRWAGVGFAPPGRMAGRSLGDLLEAFPAGTVVLAAISREAARRLSPADWQALARIGVRTVDAGQPRAHVVVGMTRARAAGLHVADPRQARLDVQPGDPIGRVGGRAPIDARLEAAATDVALTLRGRRWHVGPGVAVAFWTTRGEPLAWRTGPDPAHLGGGLLGGDTAVVSEAIATLPCIEVAPGRPVDVTEAAQTGGLGLVATAPATLEVALRGPGGSSPASFEWLEAAPTGASLRTVDADHVHVEVSGPTAAGVSLRRRVTQATATATRPLRVCGAWPVALALDPASLALRVDMGPGDEAYLSEGWHDRERAGAGHFRWMAAREAGWMVALRDGAALDFVIDAQTVDAPQTDDVIGLKVNDRRLPTQRIDTRRAAYRWSIPADTWRRGLNAIVVEAPRTVRPADRHAGADRRTLGLAVHGWSLAATRGGTRDIE